MVLVVLGNFLSQPKHAFNNELVSQLLFISVTSECFNPSRNKERDRKKNPNAVKPVNSTQKEQKQKEIDSPL